MNETNNNQTPFKAFPIILASYLAPIFALILLSRIIPDSLNIFLLGLVITVIGAFSIYYVTRNSKTDPIIVTKPAPAVPQQLTEPQTASVDVTPFQNEIASLKQSLAEQQQKESEWQRKCTDFDETIHELVQLKQENESLHKQVQSAVARFRELQETHSNTLEEHQRTVAGLREDLASRQQLGDQLEGKVRDLSYEIKTLLRLAEKPIHSDQKEQKVEPIAVALLEEDEVLNAPIQNREEAHVQLKRCLDIAQRVTGAGYLTSSPKFQEFALENSALDLRRLSDKLGDIENSALIVFSPKENKLLYANELTKQLLGINTERFFQSFHDLIHSEYTPWTQAVQQLSFKNDASVTLPITIRPGEIMQIECLLGMIQTGLFRNNLIGLLYKA